MLEPSDKLAFDGMVGRLTLDDPGFVARVSRLDSRPRLSWRQVLSVLLWTTAPLWIVFGGWTGVLVAVVSVAFSAILTSNQPRGSAPRPGV